MNQNNIPWDLQVQNVRQTIRNMLASFGDQKFTTDNLYQYANTDLCTCTPIKDILEYLQKAGEIRITKVVSALGETCTGFTGTITFEATDKIWNS